MKYRLELQHPVEDDSAFGSEPMKFIVTKTVHAERVKISGNRVDEAGEHFADYTVDFNIRDAHEVKEGWRVRQIGGYVYTVANIIPNLDRGMLTLQCVRVNE